MTVTVSGSTLRKNLRRAFYGAMTALTMFATSPAIAGGSNDNGGSWGNKGGGQPQSSGTYNSNGHGQGQDQGQGQGQSQGNWDSNSNKNINDNNASAYSGSKSNSDSKSISGGGSAASQANGNGGNSGGSDISVKVLPGANANAVGLPNGIGAGGTCTWAKARSYGGLGVQAGFIGGISIPFGGDAEAGTDDDCVRLLASGQLGAQSNYCGPQAAAAYNLLPVNSPERVGGLRSYVEALCGAPSQPVAMQPIAKETLPVQAYKQLPVKKLPPKKHADKPVCPSGEKLELKKQCVPAAKFN